jgi:hypothetical protein
MKKMTLFFCVALLMVVCASCSKDEHDLFASLYGIVNDSDSGESIGVATIVLSPGGKTTTTSSDGRFEFQNLDPAQYTITVQKTGYQTNRKTVTAIVGERVEVSIPLIKIK